MTEPIKQEIINNIFENGDKLITGPILQTVLIDMIDDVNVKDQEILSKTGSWDEAVTQIPNLATKAEVTNLSESVARDLENVDLTGYATEQWVESKGYLTEHQDISGLATKTELNAAENNLQGNITSLSESVARDLANVSVPEGVATEQWVQSQDYASKSYVDSAVSSSSVDLTGYATETWVQSQGYLKEHQDISNLATKTELTSVSQSVQTDITNLSESVANSAVWKKGTGEDSLVQKLTGDYEAYTPTATGTGSVAIGFYSKATGQFSHAEGDTSKASNYASHAEGLSTNATGRSSHAEGWLSEASGYYSHAEGTSTKASSWGSHAEGQGTETSNNYEHAQGMYNCTSSNQIFSVGAGEYANETTNRRNAVSILAVPNADSKILTSSFFVQNIGGYDGTNPEPGTNDLATVINNLPSGGGSSETIWKKGTGKDSAVLILTGADEAKTPTATGTGSIAIGSQTTASADYSHAEGYGTTASGNLSHAEGRLTIASGVASHAEGEYVKATGRCSHAEGDHTTASGEYSHAEGSSTEAKDKYSHAEGDHTTASGRGSHAEGNSTRASGLMSHAEGTYTTASAFASHAEGGYTVTSNEYEHAQGRYNYTSSNQIFSIGTGNSDTDRRNAVSVLEVDNSGSYTSSFFVQNVGGYDGTNPLPGTNDLATVINGLSSSGGSSSGGSSETLWKKGTGTDSIVQAIADGTNLPKATGERAIATGNQTEASGKASHAEGLYTNASGKYSHAEGDNTDASGWYSHAEGNGCQASGEYSHAEGRYTIASNKYEHAQGVYNHNSENQIFSVGAGEMIPPDYQTTRRNAVSILVVPNADTKINTASFFVQNVGGYDGTNPTPGTNDLATVLNNTETWTFTLEDGSTVTKTIRIG